MGSQINIKSGLAPKAKLDLVVRFLSLKGDALGRFVRSNGVYLSEIRQWRSQMEEGLRNETRIHRDTRKLWRDKIAKLERELEEAKAIIEAQKKIQKILGEKATNIQRKSES